MSESKSGGLWISLAGLDQGRARRIIESGSGILTLALPLDALKGHASRLALLSTADGNVTYVAVATSVSRSSDLERKVRIGPIRKLSYPVSAATVLDRLLPKLRRHVSDPTTRVVPVPPKTWENLLEQVALVGQLSANDLTDLRAALRGREEEIAGGTLETVAFERDAIATTLEAFGGSKMRSTYIGTAIPAPDAPFIQQLRHQNLRVIEDQMIEHDMRTFPGLFALQSAMVGAVKLSTTSGSLTVFNANRTAVERSLGVDLVYYNHRYNSFVLVQYKRMVAGRNERTEVYRPNSDRNHEKELQRMDEFEKDAHDAMQSFESYRLLRSPFFMKLCRIETPGASSGRMLQGMYFPLELWRLLLGSDAVKGPQGGLAVSFDNAKRWLSNSEFTGLLGQGWLGTAGVETDRVTRILVQALDSGKSIIAAVHEPDKTITDYARDEQGRFADWDDESAT